MPFDKVIANADKVDQNILYAAYVNKGIAYYEQNQYDKAIDLYDKALEINPGRLGAIVNKANALQETKRYDEALTYFEQAYKITTDPLRWKPTFVLVE
jgi:tetratricopeptide (TPR) repeat protein